NAQTTVIAPTGTIGLLMDCDTTGVEPDFALVKFKKLAGGGYFKIANQSLKPALTALGYDESQARDILRYVLGTLSFDVPMPDADGGGVLDVSFAEFLEEAGLNRERQSQIEEQLPGMFELSFAFNAWSIGEEGLKALGVDPAQAQGDMSWNLLRHLGLSGKQIDALSAVICGTQTVEGAPHLEASHLAVFDCANTCGKTGTRFISAHGHIRMMAAAQPFISGAISKTINLPNDATEQDIKDSYRESWELGLKANAIYRDGCKLSQPLSTKSEDADDEDVLDMVEDTESIDAAKDEVAIEIGRLALAAIDGDDAAARDLVSRIQRRPMRRRLPDTRESITHKFNVAGHEGYLTVGLYEDGHPGELFITMSKEGSTIGGVMDSLGTATSVALQYGVPVESLVRKFTHQRFEPAGMTTNRDIPFAKSLVDYIFRWMGMQFIPGYREQHAPARDGMDSDGSVATERGSEAASRVVAHDARLRHVAPIDEDDADDTAGTLTMPVTETITETVVEAAGTETRVRVKAATSVLNESLAECQEDAPPCDECGTITVRNGTCYRCLNCGHSMGCS
ncbi:MAG: vitamin B12-dependent ribonucleotide reductase, partial [Planctomycetota bacterium]